MLIERRNAMMAGKRLPYDAEVEYLESTGTQWIDTGLVADSDLGYDITLKGLTSGSSMGSMSNANNQIKRHHFGPSTNDWFFTKNGSSTITYRYVLAEKCRCIIDTVQRKWFLTRGTSTYQGSLPTDAFTIGFNFLLYARSALGMMYYGSFIIYGNAKFYKSGVLARDFIPVRFTNELGVSEGAMYDRLGVGGMNRDGSARDDGLYRNRGTGAFLMGSDKSAANGGGYKRQCVRRSHRRSSRPSARFWRTPLWKEVA